MFIDAPKPTFHQWLTYRTKPTQFGDNKNAPGQRMSEEFRASVAKNAELLEALTDEPATTPSEPQAGDFEPPTTS